MTTIRGILLIVVLAASAIACTPAASPAPTMAPAAERGTLRYVQQYEQSSMDPQLARAVSDMQLVSNMFDSLLTYKFGTIELEPALAESWEAGPDGLSWTFKLRQGVMFHKGYGEMKASDVKFSLDRIFDPELKSPSARLLASFDQVEVVDDSTVRILLKRPDPTFLYHLAATYTSVVSERAAGEKGDTFGQDPIGTGPYQFESWSPQHETVFSAFDDYWGGQPKMAELRYLVIPDSTTAYSAFEAGDVDLLQVSDPDKLKKYQQNPEITLVETQGLVTRFLGMVPTHEPFDNLKVRQAVQHAINRNDIVEHIAGGMSVPAKSPLAPGVKYYEPDVTEYAYDPEKARQLLAEAGYPDGFKVTIAVPNNDRFTKPAVVIQEQLKAVGIEAEINVMESQAFLAGFRDYPLYLLNLAFNPIPDITMMVGYSSQGPMSKTSDPQLDGWLMGAAATTDEGQREELFSQVQKYIVDQAMDVFLDHETFVYAMPEQVTGFVADPQRLFNLRPVAVEGE